MATDIWTIRSILEWCTDYLQRAGDKSPRVSAQWLLSEACALSRTELYTNFDKPLTAEERERMRGWVRRRAEGEPVQLICGSAPFRYLSIKVQPGVLIPRPETEVLVSECLAALHLEKPCARVVETEEGEQLHTPAARPIRVLDLCTGSGCIAVSIASEYPAAQVLASDISPCAVALARENAQRCGVADRVQVCVSDLFDALLPAYEASFDLAISNPPYVPSAVCDTLPEEVRLWDPREALDGGEDGLDLVRRLLPDANRALLPGGILGLELFEDTLDTAAKLVQLAGFQLLRIAPDLTGRPRVLVAQKPQKPQKS